MTGYTLMDEFHLSIYTPRGLRRDQDDAIRHTLNNVRFRAALRQAVRDVFQAFPSLSQVRVTISR